MPWEETDEYVRSGHQDSDKFDADSLRTVTISEEDGINAVTGCPKGEWTGSSCKVGVQVQSYLFKKEKGWTVEKAKDWFEKHKEGVVLPLRLHLFAESIHLEGKKVSGVAIHPKVIWHPEEGVNWKAKHDYQIEELRKAAESLSGKPFGLNHIRLLPPPNKVSRSWWDEQQQGVAFEGTVDDEIAGKIREGKFKGLSVECDWTKPGKYVMLEKTDAGVAMKNFELTSVHLLDRFPPGDKDAYIQMWEGLVLPVVPPPVDVQIGMIRELFEERLRFLEGQVAAMSQNAGALGLQSPAIVIFKEAESKFGAEIGELRSVVGTLDKLKESYLSERTFVDAKKAEFDGALKLMAERLNTPPPPESEAIVALRKEKVAMEARLTDAEAKFNRDLKASEQKFNGLHKALVESIPYPHIWASWSAGPKRMIQEQLGILGVHPDEFG